MDNLVQDLRFAARTLSKSPGFALVAVLTLALGIGANSALFSLVNAVFLRPPPGITNTERLVWITDAAPIESVSYADYLELRGAAPHFEGIAAYTSTPIALGGAEEPEMAAAQLVSGNYFGVLGVAPAPGRGFLPEEDRVPHAVAVISHALWERRFAADPGVLGAAIILNGEPFTVVGVAPPGFVGTDLEQAAEVWVPALMHARAMPRAYDPLRERRAKLFHLIGRLQPGVSPQEAEAALAVVAGRIAAEAPREARPLRLSLSPLRGWVPATRTTGTLPVMALAAIVTGLVLLIACANVANLLLARAAARRREVAIRLALGASRGRLIRQLLTESVLLALLGGTIGLLLSAWGAAWFQARFGGPLAPLDVSPDWRTLMFAFVLAVGTGVVFGLAPARRAARVDLRPALQGEGVDPRRARLQSALVIAQLTFSLVLLATAGLFLRSLGAVQRAEAGLEMESVLVLSFDLQTRGYSAEAQEVFGQELVERVRQLPGVEAASLTGAIPLVGGFFLHAVSDAGAQDSPRVGITGKGVGPGYFRTLGIPLLRGREFDEGDAKGAPAVVIVNETLARRLWPGEEAVGKRLLFEGSSEPVEVIGIARTVAYQHPGEAEQPFLYRSHAQNPWQLSGTTLLVRAAGDPHPLLPALRAELRALDASLPVYGVQTLAAHVAERLSYRRQSTTVVAGFGLLALSLAALGLYGVMAYTVTQRTREIGIRMALGARSADVLRLALGEGARLAGIGSALGLLLGLAVGRLVDSLLVGIGGADPLTFASVAVLLIGVALAASYLPARRAARVDPMIALRAE